jgi:hypothetical protein
MSFRPPGDCPVCGADVPAKARACPECGADERSGWAEDAEYAHLDLPGGEDSEWDAHRDAGRKPHKPGISQFWLWVALMVAFAVIFLWFLAPLQRVLDGLR